jgi:hypothetical protein
MRKFLPLLLLLIAAPAFAQNQTAPAHTPLSTEFLEQKYWSDLGKPTEGPRGFSLFTRNMQPKSDTLFEFWVKIVPANSTAFNRRYSLPRESVFVVQKAIVDCSKRTIFFEDTKAYDVGNKLLDPRGSDLVKSEAKTRAKAGSVGSTVFDYICVKLQ